MEMFSSASSRETAKRFKAPKTIKQIQKQMIEKIDSVPTN